MVRPDVRFYERRLAGPSTQVVWVVDGIIAQQWVQAALGAALELRQDNAEWVGQPLRVIRGQGFKRVRGGRRTRFLSLTTEE